MITDQKQLVTLSDKQLLPPGYGLEDKAFYIITEDSKGNYLSFNYCNSISDSPYVGFKAPLPEYFAIVVEQFISESFVSDKGGLDEFIKIIDHDGTTYTFIITMFPVLLDGKIVFQHLIRLTNLLNSIVPGFNQQIIEERNLHKINQKCISSVSHDFRTPLSIIYANLQLLEYHEFQLDQETIEDAFSLSRMAVKSLLRVLDKVTVVDSINKGRLEFKPGKVELKGLCERLIKELNEAEVVPDRIKYIHDNRISEIEIDEYLFTSMFTHLIFNALSYSKKNHKVIFESKLISSECVQFIVEDNGIGLAPDQINALTMFINGYNSYLTDGVGLGFAIVKECLLLQRAKLVVTSEIGKGSVFTINLPLITNV